jgi:hypothetical protein
MIHTIAFASMVAAAAVEDAALNFNAKAAEFRREDFMEMKPVQSSNIEAVGYDPDTQTLAVQFNGGGVYHYAGVSAEAHKALVEAPSVGGHFHQHIRGVHQHKKIS